MGNTINKDKREREGESVTIEKDQGYFCIHPAYPCIFFHKNFIEYGTGFYLK